jgi:hypothetical protein
MKKTIKLFGIVAAVAAIGLMATSCGDGADGGGGGTIREDDIRGRFHPNAGPGAWGMAAPGAALIGTWGNPPAITFNEGGTGALHNPTSFNWSASATTLWISGSNADGAFNVTADWRIAAGLLIIANLIAGDGAGTLAAMASFARIAEAGPMPPSPGGGGGGGSGGPTILGTWERGGERAIFNANGTYVNTSPGEPDMTGSFTAPHNSASGAITLTLGGLGGMQLTGNFTITGDTLRIDWDQFPGDPAIWTRASSSPPNGGGGSGSTIIGTWVGTFTGILDGVPQAETITFTATGATGGAFSSNLDSGTFTAANFSGGQISMSILGGLITINGTFRLEGGGNTLVLETDGGNGSYTRQ